MRSRLVCALAVLALTAPISAQLDNVGNLSFPTSGSAEAQKHFLRGVAILHSFGWKQAIAEFKQAQQIQPDFAMVYWGETLCYNHPLQAEQDGKNPRAVLARLGPTREARLAKAPTPREKGFLGAVELCGREGDWRQRRVAYMNAMEQLHQQFPKDDEVTAFYALSLLSGGPRSKTRRSATRSKRARWRWKSSSTTRNILARRTTSSTRSTIPFTRRWH